MPRFLPILFKLNRKMIQITSEYFNQASFHPESDFFSFFDLESHQDSVPTNYHNQKQVPSKTKKIDKISKEKNGQNEVGRKKRTFKGFWNREQEIEFFCGTLMFVLEHKLCDLSWKTWKPDGFYKYVSRHVSQVSGIHRGKDQDQCKIKDQSLKKAWLPHQDLIQVASNSIKCQIINLRRRETESSLTQEQETRLSRYMKLINIYSELQEEKTKESTYSKNIKKLIGFSQRTRPILYECINQVFN